jgi:hypothetical protein
VSGDEARRALVSDANKAAMRQFFERVYDEVTSPSSTNSPRRSPSATTEETPPTIATA